MTTAAEQKILADIAAAEARGDDVFGDDEEIVAPTAGADDEDGETTASTGEAAQDDGTPDDGTTTDDDVIDVQATPGQDAGAKPERLANEQPQMFKAELPADFKAKRTELTKAKAEAMKQLMDGEIDAEAYAVIDAELADKLEDLTAARIRAETLQEANTQNQEAYQRREIQKLIRSAKGTVDYTDAVAIKQFDRALAVVASDPDNEGADYADLIADAHKMVLALRGVKQAPAKVKHEPRGPGGEAPVTLRNLPAASTPNVSGGVAEQLARLSGPAYEAAFAKLSPAQRAQMLDEQQGE